MEFRGAVEMDLADSVLEKEKARAREKQKQKRPEGGVSPDPKRARLDRARISHIVEQAALRDHALADLARLRRHALADLAEGARLDDSLTSRLAERARLRDRDLAKSVESLISDLAQEAGDDYDDEDQSSVDDAEEEAQMEWDDSVDDEDQSSVEDAEEEVQMEEDESVDDDDEEEEETTVPRTHCEEVVLTEEEKESSLYMKNYMMDAYGTTSLAVIDFNISNALLELYGPEEDEDDDEDKHKDTEDESVIQILKDVDSKSACANDVNCCSGNVPTMKFLLKHPWEDMECTRDDMAVRSLDIYYKRLVPDLESTRTRFHHLVWNRLPEVDLQYVQLFNELNTLFEQKSFASYMRTASPNDYVKVKEIAKDLKLQKLRDDDLSDCAQDVFLERDTIAAHKLRTDYDLFLLECELRQNLSPGNFKADDPSEISHSAALFCPRMQQWDFKKWMDEEKLLEKSEEECKRLIRWRQDKKLAEDCDTRIRYVKLKRALAKNLKLIPEETD